MARTGRRPGASGSRERILASARAAFADGGFDGATIRGIARSAAVDPALVHHYFGTKEQLFVASIELPFDPSALVGAITEGGVGGVGDRIARFALGVWAEPQARSVLVGVFRSAARDERAAATLRGLLERTLLPAVRALGLDQPELRAAMAWSQLVGLFLGRYLLRVTPLVTVSDEDLVTVMAPILQRIVTDPLAPAA